MIAVECNVHRFESLSLSCSRVVLMYEGSHLATVLAISGLYGGLGKGKKQLRYVTQGAPNHES